MASRARHFHETDDESGAKELSLLSLARTVTVRLDCLRPELSEADTDTMLSSLAQFDFLFNVVAIGGAESAEGHVFYPSFARVRQARIQQTANRLISDDDMRQALFPLPDDDLATALNEVGYHAQREGWRYDGFRGWAEGPVRDFITEHLPPADELAS